MNSVEQRLNNPPKREFKVITIKTLKELGRRMDGQNENFNRENIKKNKTELKNTITEMKNTPEGINSRLDGTEDGKRDRVVEITEAKQKKEFKS